MGETAIPERDLPNQLEHVTAMLMDRRNDRIGVVVQQRDDLFRCGVGDAREASQIAEPHRCVDPLGDTTHDPAT